MYQCIFIVLCAFLAYAETLMFVFYRISCSYLSIVPTVWLAPRLLTCYVSAFVPVQLGM